VNSLNMLIALIHARVGKMDILGVQ
jgi:hypothetical protein